MPPQRRAPALRRVIGELVCKADTLHRMAKLMSLVQQIVWLGEEVGRIPIHSPAPSLCR